MLKKSSLAIFAIAMLLFVIPSAYSIDNSKVRYYSVIEVTETSLNLALTSLENQDFESTKNFIEFGSTHFSKNLEKLRNVDASLTDEVHISLLDLQTRQLTPENRNNSLYYCPHRDNQTFFAPNLSRNSIKQLGVISARYFLRIIF